MGNSPSLVLPPHPGHVAGPEDQSLQGTFSTNGKIRHFPLISPRRCSLVIPGLCIIGGQYRPLGGWSQSQILQILFQQVPLKRRNIQAKGQTVKVLPADLPELGFPANLPEAQSCRTPDHTGIPRPGLQIQLLLTMLQKIEDPRSQRLGSQSLPPVATLTDIQPQRPALPRLAFGNPVKILIHKVRGSRTDMNPRFRIHFQCTPELRLWLLQVFQLCPPMGIRVKVF